MTIDDSVSGLAQAFTSGGIPRALKVVEVLQTGIPFTPTQLLYALAQAAPYHPREAYLLGRNLADALLPDLVKVEIARYRDKVRRDFVDREPVMAFCLGAEFPDIDLLRAARKELVARDPLLAYAIGKARYDGALDGQGTLYDEAVAAIVNNPRLRLCSILRALRTNDRDLLRLVTSEKPLESPESTGRSENLGRSLIGPHGGVLKKQIRNLLAFAPELPGTAKPPGQAPTPNVAQLASTHGVQEAHLRQLYH